MMAVGIGVALVLVRSVSVFCLVTPLIVAALVRRWRDGVSSVIARKNSEKQGLTFAGADELIFRLPELSDASTSGLVCTARSNIFRRETPFKLEAWDLLRLKLWSIYMIRVVRVNKTLGPNFDDEQYLSDFKFVCLHHRSHLL